MSASDRSFDEKRDFIRMKINSVVKITHAGTDYQAVCKDLSGAGISILSDTEIAPGETVDLMIEQEGDGHLPFQATAQVSRVEPGESGKFVIGLAIKEIAD